MAGSEISQLDKELSKQSWGVLSVLVLGAGFLLWGLMSPKTNIAAERQKAKVEGLAYQVLEIRRQGLKGNRGPASIPSFQGEGQVGLAPDGKPYSYRVSEDGPNWVVLVWSESQRGEPTEVRIHKDQL